MDLRNEKSTAVLTIGILTAIAGLVTTDILYDRETGASAIHLAIEGTVIALSLAGVAALLLRILGLARDRRDLRIALQESHRDAKRWQEEARELMEGLGAAISRQFDRWRLTPAERDVATLLLQGHSHKQIAKRRNTSERTVRQQAQTVYRKAELGGRADLAAFFLSDMRIPEQGQ